MKMMNKKGFTLIEMLVVIAIIAILVAIVIPVVSNATTKAKEATDVANIRSAVAEYEIKTLTDAKAEFVWPTLNYADKKTGDGKTTVGYKAEVLGDANGNKTYEWKLGNIYSESTTSTTPTNPNP